MSLFHDLSSLIMVLVILWNTVNIFDCVERIEEKIDKLLKDKE